MISSVNDLKAFAVLIETLWNVKMHGESEHYRNPGINRNIMECKDYRDRGLTQCLYCINRNIMECKEKSCMSGCTPDSEY